MATHSSIFAWEIPRTEEPGGLQSMGLQRVVHDLATIQQQSSKHYALSFKTTTTTNTHITFLTRGKNLL